MGRLFDVTELQLAEGTLFSSKRLEASAVRIEECDLCGILSQCFKLIQPMLILQRPFAVLTGSGALPKLSDEAVLNLQRFIQSGGFYFCGRCHWRPRRRFLRVSSIAPAGYFLPDHWHLWETTISSTGLIFCSTDHLDERLLEITLEVSPLDTRHPLFYCHNDLSGALERVKLEIVFAVPGGETQRP